MSWSNQDAFLSTVETNSGSSSIYYDGTAPSNNTSNPILDLGTTVDFSQDFTVEFFFHRLSGTGLMTPVFIKNSTNNDYITFWPTTTTIYFQWLRSTNSHGYKSINIPSCLDRWVHIGFTYTQSSNTVHIFADGVISAFTDGLGTNFSDNTESKEVSFGVYSNVHATRMFDGYIDDFRLTQEALYTSTGTYTIPDPVGDGWIVGGTTIIYENMGDVSLEPFVPSISWSDQDSHISTDEVHTGDSSIYFAGVPRSPTEQTGQPVLTFSTASLTDDFTVEFFSFAQGGGLTTPVCISNQSTSSDSYLLWWQSGLTIYMQFQQSAGNTVFKNFNVTQSMTNRWVHIGVSYVAATGTLHMFADGVVMSYTDGLWADFANGPEFEASFMVWYQLPHFRIFTGYIDNFRITQEVLYTADYTVPDPSGWVVGGTTVIFEGMGDVGSLPLLITPTLGSLYANIAWESDPSALFYQMTYTDSVGATTVAITGTQEFETRIENLTPESVYTIEVFSSETGGEYTSRVTEDITTLENTAANFDTSTYENTDGDIDISNLDSTTNAFVSPILNELFTTSDTIVVSDSSGEIYDSTFLNLNGTVNVGDSSAILIPFDSSRGTGQSGTIVTTNGDSVVISFDDTTGEITVDGVVYAVGDSFILDGKRILVSG